MKATTWLRSAVSPARSLIGRLRSRDWPGGNSSQEAPLRAELLTADQMEQHGEILADSHRDVRAHGPDQLLPRLAENEQVLIHACELLAQNQDRRAALAAALLRAESLDEAEIRRVTGLGELQAPMDAVVLDVPDLHQA